jgi:predicted acetyltransferase
MGDHTIRSLEPAELRAACDLFRSTLYVKPTTDEQWKTAERAYQPGRTLGAFDSQLTGSELIGTTRSFDADLAVPGSPRVPMAAVTGVGVRPDRTRRGVLTELMRAQFADFAERGVPVATLYSSEGPIYGRFGYGVATLGKSYTVNRRRARLRPEVPAGGEITVLGLEASLEQVPGLYDALPRTRPGMMSRASYSWPAFEGAARHSEGPVHTAVHHCAGGTDGFAFYSVSRVGIGAESRVAAEVHLMHAATPVAFAGLWRFLLGLDLVDEITTGMRPLDEPIELLLDDPRQCQVTAVEDGTWLRLVDVPAALAAREYTGDAIVLEVTDPLLPSNSGRYRVAGDGVARTTEPADLRLGVDALAMLYLGGWRASSLHAAGRIDTTVPEAPQAADLLFGTRVPAWCGTFF